MIKLLNFIFIVVIVYYLLKLVVKIFLPWLIKYQLKKMQQHQANSYQEAQKQYKKNEGKVTVHFNNKDQSPSSNKDGDYVDFEEIKD